MKKTSVIILSSIALYAVALAAAWIVSTAHAYRRTESMLKQSEGVYDDITSDLVDAACTHTALAFAETIDGKTEPQSVERMRRFCEKFLLDEINIVRNDGVCIASSEPQIVGWNFNSNDLTREFFAVTNGARVFVSQPFRRGVSNPNDFRRYLSVRLKDGLGIVQIGYDYDRLASYLDNVDENALRAWKIGKYGNFALFDEDGDGKGDHVPFDTPDGKVVKTHEDGETVFYRAFSFADHRYLARLPAREFFSQRDVNFIILAPALAIVVIFLAFFVRSISRAAESEAKRHAAAAAAAARDLSLARTIQLSSLPLTEFFHREVYSLSFDAMSRPAREVGGDFYDFYFTDKKHLAFVIADVSGKGIPAAMFMMEAKNELFNALRETGDPSVAAGVANARICSRNDAEMFVTAWLGVIDIESGRMEYVNAGHNRPFIKRASGTVEKTAGTDGLFFGMFPDAKYRAKTLEFHPGDTLLLFTDGVTEALNRGKELYGEFRLAKLLDGISAKTSPKDILSGVETDVDGFAAGAEQSDDITALALVWHGEPKRRAREFAVSETSLGPAMQWLRGEVGIKDSASAARLLNAADEIMANVVMHSGAGNFYVSVENAPGRTRIVFRDDGKEYNPLLHKEPKPDEAATIADKGGLGILMTRHLVDGLNYHRNGEVNELSLVKFG